MSIYLPMIVCAVLFAWIGQHSCGKQRNIVMIISTLFPIVWAAVRYDNGSDYLMYLKMMKIYGQIGSTIDSFVSVKTTEIGFYLLLKLCGLLFDNAYFIIFGFIAGVICGFFFTGIYQQTFNWALAVFLFFSTGVYFDSYNGLRQYIAVAIVFYALKYIWSGNFKRYCFIVLIAMLFHYTAVIMIPMYFVRFLKINFKKACIVAGSCIIGGKVLYSIVSYLLGYTRYKYFLTSVEYTIMVTEAAILFTTVISIVTIGYAGMKRMKISPKLQMLINMQLFVWCSALLSLSIPLAWRVQYYFLPFEIIYIPCFLKEIPDKKRKATIGTVLVVMYTVITFYGMVNNDWYDCIPYKFYFDYM